MREIKHELELAKKRVNLLKGKEIFIKVNKGRNKYVSFGGHIESVYPSIFTVKCEDGAALQSFSYNDILTKNILFYPPQKRA